MRRLCSGLLRGRQETCRCLGGTPANAKMRSSRVLTSRSRLRQRNKSRLDSSGTTQNPFEVYTSSDSLDVTLASSKVLDILTDSIVQHASCSERSRTACTAVSTVSVISGLCLQFCRGYLFWRNFSRRYGFRKSDQGRITRDFILIELRRH